MLQRTSGYIINTASASGLVANEPVALAEQNIAYATTKFGVVGFSEALFAYLRLKGISVSVICPHFVDTNIAANSRYWDKGSQEYFLKVEDLEKQKDAFFRSPDVQTPEYIAQLLVKGMNEGRIMILTHPPFQQELKENRGQDIENWNNICKILLKSQIDFLETLYY